MLKQLITTLLVTLLATGVFGQTWNCGVAPNQTSVKASLSNGTLTLSGSGAMQDYESGEARPWEAKKDEITTIVITLANGNKSITSIGNYAFSNLKNLKSVEIQGNEKKHTLQTIGEGAFSNCTALTTVALPHSVVSIGNDAFAGCTSLTTVDIQLHNSISNSNLENIGNSAFEGCSSLTSFGVDATANQGEINIPTNVTNVGDNSFSDCSSITNVTFPDGTIVGDGAFSGCENLKEVNNLPESKNVGDGAFSGCENLTNVGGETVSVKSEELYGFELQRKSFGNQTLSLKITGVTEDAKGQNKFVIARDITDISDGAFAGCTVEYLIYESNVLPSVKNNLFSDEQLAKIKLTIVSTNILEKYSKDERAKYGCNFNTTRLTITNEKYCSCTFLHNVIIPEGVAVYTAMLSEDGNSVRLTKVNNENESGYVVNSGKGVLLRAITTGSYDFVGTTGTGEEFADNILMGAEDRTTLTNKDNYDYYVLQTHSGVQKFYIVGDGDITLAAGKAYLRLDKAQNAKILSFYDHFVTGIEETEDCTDSKAEIYNMVGQKLSTTCKGLNIVNGKIVLK